MQQPQLQSENRFDTQHALAEYTNLLFALWRRKGVLALTLGVCWLLAIAAYLVIPPVYQSKARVLVVRKGLLNGPTPGQGSTTPPRNRAVHERVLTSNAILQTAMDRGDLLSLPTFQDAKDPLKQFSESLSVETELTDPHDPETAMFALSFRGRAPEDCPRVITALIESYQEFINRIDRAERDAIRPQLDQWRDSVAAQLQTKREAYQQLRLAGAETGADPSESLSSVEAYLTALKARKLELEVRRSEIERRLDALREAREQDIDPSLLAELAARWTHSPDGRSSTQDKFQTLLLREQELLSRFGRQHPEVQAIREQIRGDASNSDQPSEAGGSGGQFTSQVESLMSFLEKDLEVIKQIETSLEDPIAEAREKAIQSAAVAQQAELMRDEIGVLQQLHRDIASQGEVLELAEQNDLYNEEIIAAPTLGKKVAPSLKLLGVISTVLGFLGGGVLALLRDTTDRSLRTPEDVVRRLSSPLLGQVPRLPSGRKREDASNLDPILHAFHQSGSAETDAFRAVWISLCSVDRRGTVKTLQLTSPVPHSGTSTLAANLAIAIAETGRRVLLVDAQLQNPRQHELFGLPGEVGLCSLLRGDEQTDAVVKSTPIAGLSVLPAGKPPENAATLLHSPGLKELLQTASSDYDLVVLDGPQVLGGTQACTLATQVDGVLLVVNRASDSTQAARSLQILRSLHATVLGVVMNRVQRKGGNDFGPMGDMTELPVERPLHERDRHEIVPSNDTRRGGVLDFHESAELNHSKVGPNSGPVTDA